MGAHVRLMRLRVPILPDLRRIFLPPYLLLQIPNTFAQMQTQSL